MPTEIRKIDPLDFQPRKAVGVSLPFSGKAVFSSTYQTRDAIKTNLINYFLTARGERYLNPTFGNELQNLLFENMNEDSIRRVDALVREDLSVFFPRIIPVDISTIGDTETGTIQFSLKYQVSETNIEDEVVINFN
jgi:phage baseplate assembly protein W